MSRMDIFERTRGVNSLYNKKKSPGLQNKNLEYIKERLNGKILQDGSSSLLKVEYHMKKGYIHGTVPLGELHISPMSSLKVLFPNCMKTLNRDISLSDLIFFDIETTGLSGGAGTYIFLIGILKVDEGGIHITQYFLINLTSERLLLQHLRNHLNPEAVLVSYNGKSFDYNVIKNRYILNGFSIEEDDPAHIDLLYPSRRLWKGLFPDFTLQTVERRALGLERSIDIPGYRIPEVYFQYLGDRNTLEDLYTVFIHNKNDVLTLLALFIKQIDTVQSGMENNKEDERFNPVTLSDMLMKSNYRKEARGILDSHNNDVEALKRLGLICKKERLFNDALIYFKRSSERSEKLEDYSFACTEIAKIYEHILKDIESALFYAEKVYKRMRRVEYFYPGRPMLYEREKLLIEKRLKRLRVKLAKRS